MNVKRVSMQELVGSGYADFWRTQARYRVCKGSRGSKKSKTAALSRIYRILKYPECNYLCIRRYGNGLRDSIYADTKWAISQMGLDQYFDYTVSPLEVTYIPTGQKILFRGLDEGSKITSITVPHGYINYVDFEEAFEIDEKDFDKVDLSIRGNLPEGYFKQLTLIFNPWSANSWLKRRFFDNPDEDTFTKTTTWECNEWLDDNDRKVFLKMKEQNPRRYLIEGAGEWGIAEGLIYEKFEQQDFDPQEIRRRDGILSSFSLDFGFTDPNAFICAMVDNRSAEIFVFDEWFKTGVTNKEIAQQIKSMGYGGQRIICDSAEPKSIEELRDEGINAEGSRKGKDSVLFGIQQLQNYKIIVHPRCTEFWKEINNYCWEKDRLGNPTDRPEHEFSHGMDALRYGTSKLLMGDLFSF